MVEVICKVITIRMIEVSSNVMKTTEIFDVDSIKGFLRKFTPDKKILEKISILLSGRRHLYLNIDEKTGNTEIKQISFTKRELVHKKDSKMFTFDAVKDLVDDFGKLSKSTMISMTGN